MHRPTPGPTGLHLARRRRSRRLPRAAAALALAGLLAPGASTAQAANNPGTGDSGFFTFRPAAVAGTQINVASGNALIRTRDLTDGLLTYHVVVDRTYNSLAANDFSILSPRWKFDVGPDTRLSVEPNQDVTVNGPSGYRVRFDRQSDGSYVPPEGFDGSLTKTVNGWTLIRASQNDEFGFDNNGTLTWTKDSEARDFTIQGTSAAGRTVLSSYGTNSGRRVNLSYNGDSLVRLMDDPASGHHSYRYTSGRLTEYESPTGAKTTYDYDSNGFLDEIVQPGGTKVELDVLSSGKINSITTTLPGGVPQTTGFVYTRRTYKSDVIAPNGVRRTYAYDEDWRVTRQYNPDEVPEVSASGELKDLEGGYVGPNRTYPVTVTATQPDGAGLRRLWLTLVPENELAGQNVPCTTTPFDLVCPQTYDVPLDIDFAPLPEGPTTVRGAARDDEQNRGNSPAWEVTVDKSAPTDVTPSGELFDVRDGYINGQGTKSLAVSAVDPNMPNGTRLSGIKRFQLEDIGNGIIASTDASCTPLACPVTASETLSVDTTQFAEGPHQLRIVATDLVGNVTRSDPWTVLVDRTAPGVPTDFLVEGMEPSLDQAIASWSPGADPDIAVDVPGSQADSAIYRAQVDGAWSAWQTVEDDAATIAGAGAGEQVTIEARSVDMVGNLGEIGSLTVTVESAIDPSEADGNVVGTGPHDLRVAVRRSLGDGDYDQAPDVLMTATSADRTITVRADEQGVATFPRIEVGTYRVKRMIDSGSGQQVVIDGNADQEVTFTIGSSSSFARGISDEHNPLALVGDLRVWCITGKYEDVDTPGLPNLYSCRKWQEDSDLAIYLENRLFFHEDAQDSTRGNAFRHMVWNALMVASVYQSSLIQDHPNQYEQALILSTDVYEYPGRHTSNAALARASTMDRHNNRVGWGYMRRRTPDRLGSKIPDFGVCKRIRRLVGSVQKATYKTGTGQFSKPFNRFRPVYNTEFDIDGYRVRLKPQTATFDPCGPLKPGREDR